MGGPRTTSVVGGNVKKKNRKKFTFPLVRDSSSSDPVGGRGVLIIFKLWRLPLLPGIITSCGVFVLPPLMATWAVVVLTVTVKHYHGYHTSEFVLGTKKKLFGAFIKVLLRLGAHYFRIYFSTIGNLSGIFRETRIVAYIFD